MYRAGLRRLRSYGDSGAGDRTAQAMEPDGQGGHADAYPWSQANSTLCAIKKLPIAVV